MGEAEFLQWAVLIFLCVFSLGLFALAWSLSGVIKAQTRWFEAVRDCLDGDNRKLRSALDALKADFDTLCETDYARRRAAARAICPEAFDDEEDDEAPPPLGFGP